MNKLVLIVALLCATQPLANAGDKNKSAPAVVIVNGNQTAQNLYTLRVTMVSQSTNTPTIELGAPYAQTIADLFAAGCAIEPAWKGYGLMLVRE